MDETLWKHKEKKWKPRNKQAALVARKANPLLLHTPPQRSTFEPTLTERLAAESKIRLERIESIEKESKERRERRAAFRMENRTPPKVKVWRNLWAAKHAKRMAKSRGLPAPTPQQLKQICKAQPNYGKSLFSK